MKKYFTTIAMAMVMMVVLAVPVYANGDCCPSIEIDRHDKHHHNTTIKNNRGIATNGDGNVIGNETKIIVKDNNTAFNGGTIIEGNEGPVINGGIKNKNVVKNSGNSDVDIDNVDINCNRNVQDQGQKQKQQQGQIQGQTATSDQTQTATSDQTQTQTNEGNHQTVNIESPDKIKVNSQLSPMAGQQTGTIEYHGETLEDHKYQDEILQFLLAAEGPKPFKVKEHGLFTRKSAHSDSKDLSVKEYTETTTVYVFRDMADLKANIKNYSIVGYADTFSKGKASLMDCFDQGVIDAGEMGGNIVVILDISYINALKSTTTGLGGSGATGLMKGANQSSVFGAALGYASSKATPETDPFIHGMILYSAELPAEN